MNYTNCSCDWCAWNCMGIYEPTDYVGFGIMIATAGIILIISFFVLQAIRRVGKKLEDTLEIDIEGVKSD